MADPLRIQRPNLKNLKPNEIRRTRNGSTNAVDRQAAALELILRGEYGKGSSR